MPAKQGFRASSAAGFKLRFLSKNIPSCLKVSEYGRILLSYTEGGKTSILELKQNTSDFWVLAVLGTSCGRKLPACGVWS
eukprot:scaffold6917_cov19-Tisochrysis_lutea.AAC.2